MGIIALQVTEATIWTYRATMVYASQNRKNERSGLVVHNTVDAKFTQEKIKAILEGSA